VGNWLNMGGPQHRPGQPGVGGQPGAAGGYQQGPNTQYAYAQQAQYTPPPPPGFIDPAVPPAPPVPPVFWRRKEPIGAVILIGFGLLLLMNQLGFLAERVIHILWPLIFIALGAWLVVRRLNDTPPQGPPSGQPPVQGGPGMEGGAR
jgi:hypothetical protein